MSDGHAETRKVIVIAMSKARSSPSTGSKSWIRYLESVISGARLQYFLYCHGSRVGIIVSRLEDPVAGC